MSRAFSTSAASRAATRGCLAYDESGDGARVKADILGQPVEFRIGAPGAHIAANALGALLVRRRRRMAMC